MAGTLIRNGTVISSLGSQKADVLLHDGVVQHVSPPGTEHPAAEVIDAKGMLLFPGLIDCHVHFREPGFPHKATMASEAASALAGGVTTVCEMPNTSPPTVTVAALADKVRRSENIKDLDMHFFFGITEDIHLSALRELFESTSEEAQRLRKYVCGVKLYLDHSTGDQKVEESLLDEIFSACATHHIPIVAHCEDPHTNKNAALQNTRTDIAAHSLMRPAESEVIAIERAIELADKSGAHLHIAHLSTARGVQLVRQAKIDDISVTCEVTPHHLFFTTDDYEKMGALIKMNPPIRSREHVVALWEGIRDKTVDCISTDHAPHTLEEKQNPEPLKAPSGVPGVETMIPLLFSVCEGKWPSPDHSSRIAAELSAAASLSYEDIHRLCFENPNRIFNLHRSDLTEGARTSVLMIDPKHAWKIQAKDLHSQCDWTPFEDWSVHGKALRVF